MSSESSDIAILKKILSGISADQIYWDVYQDFRNQAWNTGNFDKDYCLLDNWVWKYREYTIKQFRATNLES